MRQFLIWVFIFTYSFILRGTEIIWFAPPAISSALGDTPIELILSSGNHSTSVIIDMPANPSFGAITMTINPNSTSVVNLTSHLAELEPQGGVVENTGLRIIASPMIFASYRVGSAGHLVSYDLKGSAALGKSFVIPGQDKWTRSTSVSPLPRIAVDIVATEDSTTVTIILPSGVSANGYAAGSTFNLTMNEGQTYSLYSTSAILCFRGTVIKSNKHIAVSLTEDGLVYAGHTDVVGDQLIPISKCGNSFAVVRGGLLDGVIPHEYVEVMAVNNGVTNVFAASGNPSLSGIGEHWMFDLQSGYGVYTASNRAMCVQYSGVGNQLSMSLIPDIEDCSGGDSATVYRPGTDDLFAMVIVKNGAQGKFSSSISPNPFNASAFSNMAGGIGYKYAIIALNTSQLNAGSTFWVTNSSSYFHLFLLYGSNTNGSQFHLVTPYQFEQLATLPIFHFD